MVTSLIAASTTTETAQLFFSLLMFLCQFFVLGVVILRVAAFFGESPRRLYSQFRVTIQPLARGLAFIISLVTMLGSLYFSEIANYEPCHFCWIQRYFLYPQVLICGLYLLKPNVAWLRRISITLAICDLPVSTYHFLIERYPSLESGHDFCTASGPTCTFAWFREFGFVTLSLMAWTSALTILTLMLLSQSNKGKP